MVFEVCSLAAKVVSDSSVGGSVAEQSRGELMLVLTVTGLFVVFAVLVLLTLLFLFYGKLLDRINESKKKKDARKISAGSAAVEPPKKISEKKPEAVKRAVTKESAPASESDSGIPEEIIAVIAAAVASLDGNYVVKSVKRTRGGVSAWRQAALSENTRRF